MSCCSTKTVESKLEPYQLRALLIKRIHRFSQKGIFGQGISVFRELSKDLGVSAATRRLSNLGIAEFLKAREILVDRQAHRYLQRLQEALFRKDERQVSQMCKLLTKQFNFAPTDDIMEDLKRQNKATLKQRDLESICIYGLDLSKKKNFEKLLALLRRCPNVKKIELSFCKLGHGQILELFQGVTKVEKLYFLGLRGNRLEMKAVHKLLSLLEDPENFQTLLWVDFRNNKEINTIPGQFVDLLAKRKEKNSSIRKASHEEILLAVKDAIRGKIE